MERSEIKCTCGRCGKTWRKGEQDDNETLCLRCEAQADALMRETLLDDTCYGIEDD